MLKKLKDPNVRRLIIYITIFVIVSVSIYLIFHSQGSSNHQTIRQLQKFLTSFGGWSPIVIILLILISTVIPPLPLPVPLVELAAGLVLGFWEAFIVVWISQIISSVAAFYIARFFNKSLFVKILNNHTWDTYKNYLNKKNGLAIFITRFTMASPFNIISYLAGLTRMSLSSFLIATAFGTIPEALLYSFIGSKIKGLHISLLNLFTATAVIGLVGLILTIVVMRLIKPSLKSDNQS